MSSPVLGLVTSLAVLDDRWLLAGRGTFLSIHDIRPRGTSKARWSKLFNRERIHSIVVDGDRVLVTGGKEAKLLSFQSASDEVPEPLTVASFALPDWCHSSCFISTTHVGFATAHNSVLLYSLATNSHTSIHAFFRPLLWCACFSRARYESFGSIRVAGGSMLGDVWSWGLAEAAKQLGEDGGEHTVTEEDMTVFNEHEGSIFGVAFSPDGSKLASGSDDRTVRIWSTSDPSARRTLWGHTGRVWRVTWLSNTRVLSTAEDNSAILWDVETGKQLKCYGDLGDGKTAWSVCALASRDLFWTGGADAGVRCWKVKESREKDVVWMVPASGGKKKDLIKMFDVRLDGIGKPIVAVITKQNKIFCHGDGLSSDLIASLPLSGKCLVHLTASHLFWVLDSSQTLYRVDLQATSPDEAITSWAVGTRGSEWRWDEENETITVFDRGEAKVMAFKVPAPEQPLELLFSLSLLQTLFGAHSDGGIAIKALLFDLPTQRLYVGDSTGVIAAFDTAADNTPRLIASGKLHRNGVFDIASYIADGGNAVTIESVSRDGSRAIHVLDERRKQFKEMERTNLPVSRVEKILPRQGSTGKRYLASKDHTIEIFDSRYVRRAVLECLPGATVVKWRHVEDQKAHYVYRVNLDQVLVDSMTKDTPHMVTEPFHGREIRSVKRCPVQLVGEGETLLATGSEDGQIRLSVWGDGLLVPVYEDKAVRGAVKALTWLPLNGRAYLLASCVCETTHAWRVGPGPSNSDSKVAVVSLSPSSFFTLTKEIRIMDLAAWPIAGLADRALVIGGCSDGFLRSWIFSDSEEGSRFDLIGETPGHPRCIMSIAAVASPSANVLVSGASDGSVHVWDVTPVLQAISQHLSHHPGLIPTAKLDLPVLLYRPHQSAVNGLDAVSSGPDELEILSGGDDNALVAQRVALNPFKLAETRLHRTAHGATVSDVQFIDARTAVSTSVDQRVCRWQLSSTEIAHLDTSLTDVADCSAIEYLPGATGDDTGSFACAGTGLQVVRLAGPR